jgi:hypothetical protein
MLRVTSVENEGADTWRDPDSTWECDGVRSRKWFPLSALPKVRAISPRQDTTVRAVCWHAGDERALRSAQVKAPGDDLLVAMAGIPPEQRRNVRAVGRSCAPCLAFCRACLALIRSSIQQAS